MRKATGEPHSVGQELQPPLGDPGRAHRASGQLRALGKQGTSSPGGLPALRLLQITQRHLWCRPIITLIRKPGEEMNQWPRTDFLNINLSNYRNSIALSFGGSLAICLAHYCRCITEAWVYSLSLRFT